MEKHMIKYNNSSNSTNNYQISNQKIEANKQSLEGISNKIGKQQKRVKCTDDGERETK